MGVALAACAGAPPAPPPLSVTLVQQRGDIVSGRVQLRVTNTSDAAVTVTSAVLRSPLLAATGGGDTKRPETLQPGRTIDLPVALPDSRCDPDAADAAPEAVLDVSDDRGTLEQTVAVDDALGVLPRLSATQCDRETLASVARVSATAVSVSGDGTAALLLSIEPTPDATAGSVELVSLRGTPLLRFPQGTEAPLGLTVAAGDAPTTIAVPVTPIRCDAHAIAEDKVGTLFDLVARVDGRDVVVPLDRPQAVADALLAFTASVCGLTP